MATPLTSSPITPPASTALTPDERERFERDGFLVVPGVLDRAEVLLARAALDRARARAGRRGELGADGSLHRLSAVASCPELAFLLDHPRTFGHVWSVLGWNVHVYHSHVDVHPPTEPTSTPYWAWHQDGGRQNRELETDPRPRLSVKLAYFLSDLTETGRGNLTVVPGSHRTNWLPGPPRRNAAWPEPEGAIQLQLSPGDALFFDRRLWHRRGQNTSDLTRYAAFIGYTHRWIAVRDEVTPRDRHSAWWAALNPVQQQLLGGTGHESGDHRWGHFPQQTASYRMIRDLGALDPSFPPLIPDAPDAAGYAAR